jgi:hypothetical protein
LGLAGGRRRGGGAELKKTKNGRRSGGAATPVRLKEKPKKEEVRDLGFSLFRFCVLILLNLLISAKSLKQIIPNFPFPRPPFFL